ncbi:hypothetical protein TrRE_jg2686, partial [Triparma retinervis]
MDLVGRITVIKRSGKDGARLDWDVEKEGLLVGRHEDCDIRVQLPTVSRRHATLAVDKKSKIVTIVDHSSVNTTTVNNIGIKGKTVIKHGDKITFGDRSFRFEYDGGKTPTLEGFEVAGDENSAALINKSLDGDATQDLSKFVRVTVPKMKPKLPTVKETAPVEAPVAAPVVAPVVAPVEAPVEAPIEPPVEAPVEAPVQAPVEAPVQAAFEAPVQAPVEPLV